uniref:EB domain-containing protein n=1 Tax=Meloidogyne hapla TaxID=6305 RepID=A0A1I8BYL3_MELHA
MASQTLCCVQPAIKNARTVGLCFNIFFNTQQFILKEVFFPKSMGGFNNSCGIGGESSGGSAGGGCDEMNSKCYDGGLGCLGGAIVDAAALCSPARNC